MNRNHVAGILLAVMLVLAGCAGPAGTQTATDSTASNDGTAQPYVSSGDKLNATKLSRDHESALGDAGSYTATKVTTVGVKGGMTMHSETTAKIDAEDNQFWKKQNSTFATQVVYTDEKKQKTYQKVIIRSNNNTTEKFRVGSEPYTDDKVQPVDAERQTSSEFIESFVANTSYTMEGVETYNGTTVTRFSASGADAYSGTGSLTENQTVTKFNSTLLVSQDGYVRYISVTIAIEDTSRNQTSEVSLTMAWTNVGSTDVTEPAWTARAEEQASTTESDS